MRELVWAGAALVAIGVAALVVGPRLSSLAERAGDPAAVGTAPTASAPAAAEDRAVPAPAGEPQTFPRAAAPVTIPPSPLVGVRLQTRWTNAWANMRLGPDTTARVLRALPPGTEVSGARGALGWWAIQLADDSVGFIAGALLSATPVLPDTLPPP